MAFSHPPNVIQPAEEDFQLAEERGSQRQPGLIKRLRKPIAADVTTKHADILFRSCLIISGLIDSTIHHAYGTFVSMQEGVFPHFFCQQNRLYRHTDPQIGNTIILGLGGATPHRTSNPYGWAKALTSFSCACVGYVLLSNLSRMLGPLRRGTLVLGFLLQSSMIILAAAIMQAGLLNGDLASINDDIYWRSEIPIATLSFQAAGQIIASRSLILSQIPAVALDSMLHDTSADPKMLSHLQESVKRNRRLFAFFSILVGAVAGGFISEATGMVQMPLWIAGIIKVVITLAWMVWPMKRIREV